MLPTLEEARDLVPRRGGHVWRLAGDVRGFSTAGYAVLLQVAHPTVGAGVGQYSGFLDDPWGRLLRTLDYVNGSVYGGPRMAWEIGRRVHGIHKAIKGTRPDGEPYHALEPKAYAWVHATLASALADGARTFGTPLEPHEEQDFWDEWKRLGLLIGVRLEQLPERWADFHDYFDEMVENELEDSETLQNVIHSVFHPVKPPLPGIPEAIWSVASWPGTELLRLTTVGSLPAKLRERLGLPWNRERDIALRAQQRAIRGLMPRLPDRLRLMPPAYAARRGVTLVPA
jgi:uncharacterized protein (DUF2236 family)